MADPETALLTTSTPFSTSTLERDIVASMDLDAPGRAAMEDRLRFTAFSFLAGVIIRDARMLAKCKLFKPNDEDRSNYVRAVGDCLGHYHSLFPEKMSASAGPRVIDVLATTSRP